MLRKLQTVFLLVVAATLTACGAVSPQVRSLEKRVDQDIKTYQAKAAEKIPVITSTPAAWLAGAPVQIAEPTLPILSHSIGYHPTKAVSLADVAAWISQNYGLAVDIAELQSNSANSALNSTTTVAGAQPGLPNAAQTAVPVGNVGGVSNMPLQQSMYTMYINYDGPLSGLLDVAANKSNAWWKIVDGRASFYREETKTFFLPLLARKYTGDSSISSNTSSAASSGSTTTTTGATNTGGANSISNYVVDFWADLDKTAKIVAAGGQVSTNPSAGSITVTGTPAQVRHVEDWSRSLRDQLSQQVAINIHVYSVKVTNEDNYSLNPSVIFQSASGVLGYSLKGPQSPAVISGKTPFDLGVSILSNSVSGKTSEYSGSQLAFKALSTLGQVVEHINQTVVTLNGQPAPIQMANQTGYLKSSSTTQTANVGTTTTLEPGTITTGFTAMLFPRIVNGKIILGVTMTNSTNNGFTNISSGGATIQNPNVDSNTFQQSVSLTPGDALLLTGLQRDNGSASKSGVGIPSNYLLGGGFDDSLGKQIVAIVISATIL